MFFQIYEVGYVGRTYGRWQHSHEVERSEEAQVWKKKDSNELK